MRRQYTLARLMRLVNQSREIERYRDYPRGSYQATIRTNMRLRRNRVASRILRRSQRNRAEFRDIANTNEVLRHMIGYVPEYEPR